MSIFDNIGDKAKDLAGEHSDKVDEGIERAGDAVDEKTGGRFSDQIDQGQEAAGNFVEGLGGDNEEDQQ
ncbi:MAG: antitoxin [Streptosporangiales bacterium]|nr:antitoxin [Streptosporangiales bacterium]